MDVLGDTLKINNPWEEEWDGIEESSVPPFYVFFGMFGFIICVIYACEALDKRYNFSGRQKDEG